MMTFTVFDGVNQSLAQIAGQVEGIRKIMPMCLVFDHRVLDFNDLVPFIDRLETLFHNPSEMVSW